MGQWKYNPFTHKQDYYPEDSDIDHGGLAGLTDVADHPGYVTLDGARALTGDWDIGNGRIIDADEIRARDADDLRLYNAAGTSGIFVDGISGKASAGNISPDRKWHVEEQSGSTNLIRPVARYTHITTATPASGIGVAHEFEVETSANNNEILAIFEVLATDVNATKEDGAFSFKTMSSGNLASEKMRIGADEIDVNAPLVIGNFEFDEDTGIATAMDMPVGISGVGEMGYEFKVDGENIFRVSADSDRLGGVTNERVRISGIEIQNALTTHKTSQVVADNAHIDIATGVTGWGFVQAGNNEEHAQFSFTEIGAVTLISNTANVTTVGGSDGKLNIYDAGAGVAIENKLGAAKKIRFDIHYS